MKIAIISDTHDNLANIKLAVSWIVKEKIRVIIHCGDVSKEEVLEEGLSGFNGRIFLARGNCDLGDFTKISKLKFFTDYGEMKLGKSKIAISHFPKTAETLAGSGKYNFVFYGHSHKPWMSKVGKTKLVNPGNLAGVFYKATFAVYDDKKDKLDLKILERL
jgi:uncharacterized protein